MSDPHELQRFLDAQDGTFECALGEIAAGSKQSHWMWFIFPQLAGLGHSRTAQFYGIKSREEAQAYLAHPVLGTRLRQCTGALLPWSGRRTAEQILGPVDALKLRSCMTLFDQIEPKGIFTDAISAFFDGEPDRQTLALLNGRA